ncbi:integrin alpha-8-like [Ptychodera flava]|uniref:integrin alpha-8-like n=1 Tax=Ptychodera flava TaxID=63121 RepID=UPI00396A74EC
MVAPWIACAVCDAGSLGYHWNLPGVRTSASARFVDAMTTLSPVHFWIFSLLPVITHGFNVDTSMPVIHAGPDSSFFGFSVSLHQTQSAKWLIIGAPEAQTDQLNVTRGGAVYKCPAAKDSSRVCQQIPFDTTGVPYRESANGREDLPLHYGQKPIPEKSHQWFGATVKSSGRNGVIAACAPCRFVYVANVVKQRHDRYLIGTCYTANSDFKDVKEYSPCPTHELKINRVGYCQAGISADVTKNKKHLAIGAVGSFYWQGQIYSQSLNSRQKLSSQEGPKTADYSYLGYSVAVGEFTYDSSDDYVAGAPRSNDLKGMVKVFDSELHLLHQLMGEQLGAYFGFAVCVEDLNNDGLDDIVVGAPFFSDRTGTIEKWEAGRVYVYYQRGKFERIPSQFDGPDRLTGTQSKARFGSAIASLSDINYDEYKDIIIGAPYGGDDERGQVYIYNGSPNGIRKQPAQVIKASDISHDLKTFGFSLSGGLDMDDNHYPDILIGAYESDQAVLLKTRPVIDLDVDITLTPDNVDLEIKTCLQDGTRYACFMFTRCFSYSGRHVPSTIEIEYETNLDALKELPKRTFFPESGKAYEKKILTLHKKKDRVCEISRVHLKGDVKDKYSAIAVDISTKLMGTSPKKNGLSPILNAYVSPVVRKLAYIMNNCGEDKICIPDLVVSAEISKPIYVGSPDNTTLEVLVNNEGEDAFKSEVFIWLPEGFDYVRVEQREAEYTVDCGPLDEVDMPGVVKCGCGNPIKTASKVDFGLVLSANIQNTTTSSVQIHLLANSSNPEESEENLFDNEYRVSIPFEVKISVAFSGVSVPEQVKFKPRPRPDFVIDHENDIGPEIIQLYELRNQGPSAIDGADIQIFWPAYTYKLDYLLYLLDVQLQGGVPCITRDLNPEGIKLDEDKLSFQVNLTDGIEHARRVRRNAVEEIKEVDIDCKSAFCISIECPIDFVLKSGESAFLQIRSRLWKDTLLKCVPPGCYDKTEITSEARVQITSVPYKIPPDGYPEADAEVTTIANTEKPQPRTLPVPLWVLAVSVASGLLLLILMIIGLWKAGFFKRKRVEDKYIKAQNDINDCMSTFSGSPAFASLSTADSEIKSSRSNSYY